METGARAAAKWETGGLGSQQREKVLLQACPRSSPGGDVTLSCRDGAGYGRWVGVAYEQVLPPQQDG